MCIRLGVPGAAAVTRLLSYLDGFSGFAGNGSAITLRWAEKTQAHRNETSVYAEGKQVCHETSLVWCSGSRVAQGTPI